MEYLIDSKNKDIGKFVAFSIGLDDKPNLFCIHNSYSHLENPRNSLFGLSIDMDKPNEAIDSPLQGAICLQSSSLLKKLFGTGYDYHYQGTAKYQELFSVIVNAMKEWFAVNKEKIALDRIEDIRNDIRFKKNEISKKQSEIEDLSNRIKESERKLSLLTDS